jgi:hypothetical protein
MKRSIFAACLAGALAVPGHSQTTSPPPQAEEPIPLPGEEPGGPVTPGSLVAGSAAGAVIFLIGAIIVAVGISSLGGSTN